MKNRAGPLVFCNGTAILPDRLVPDAVVICREGRIISRGTAAKIRIPRDAEIVDARVLDRKLAVKRVFIGGQEFTGRKK